ncbi:hypothetical protein WDW89_06280 [Deltaproteobacteria bacterium TL4]
MINLTPHAIDHPVQVTEEQYQELVQRTAKGWSVCDSPKECLAKLQYLREGFRTGKIDENAFRQKEETLVLNWWRQGL